MNLRNMPEEKLEELKERIGRKWNRVELTMKYKPIYARIVKALYGTEE